MRLSCVREDFQLKIRRLHATIVSPMFTQEAFTWGRIAPNGTPVVVQTGASVIVVNSAGEILMQQRQDDGTWSYPGGRVEIDETVEDAARREVLKSLAFL